ncbi:L-lysine 2,3-aminomutase [Arsenophonus endosymbiont of Aleurodicus dispersus]|uniref:EF-P beta-lysylation protein EpmB n=1 Tax=Arsenophonus endosymbiont of Aleurodicus dispersus TaxID=235559 RepID=UPI000EAE4B30|nr:EF-P beta-lysylation protein EpmB [Arsenophonus endosymbiont of Aleurodicus dispersus]VAY02249.1 L-lysine 2,3-aminomutase [Arsenophonus endosymbiont of Aleurodicus dispersus]
MFNIVTKKKFTREVWLQQLTKIITDPDALLRLLSLQNNPELRAGSAARALFPLRVPHKFIAKMRIGDAHDPLLRQVIPVKTEFNITPTFSTDPLNEKNIPIPGLLHKYPDRVLLLVKGSCAVNCRYCFRRHFPYEKNKGNKKNWQNALNYIQRHTELNEVIFSGGDPLMAKDHELDWLMLKLEAIPHIKRLRIHSRLPVVIPARITTTLCQRLNVSRLQVIMVTHINHANEIDSEFSSAMKQLKQVNVTLLNQSVLLRGVNNNADCLAQLSNKLFENGILPYYLHLLDKVQGAAHFIVTDEEARIIMKELLTRISGYLVPRLTREIGGKLSKIQIDLKLQ